MLVKYLAAGWALSFGVQAAAESYQIAPTPKSDQLAKQALDQLFSHASAEVAGGNSTACDLNSVSVRREWSSLSLEERIHFTDSVLCMMSKPSINDPVAVPGAKSRYDDFVVPHMNQTGYTHFTANFLSWHRYLLWAFEQAIREECGYKGYLPYWNWGKYAHDPINSPLFDGGPGSIGSNGVYEPQNCTITVEGSPYCVPPGEGGGCIQSGPFSNVSVNLGPISTYAKEAPADLFRYNPRCIKRDIITAVSSQWTTEDNITATLEIPTFDEFQFNLTGDVANGQWGIHTAGHYTLLGDPGTDVFAAPADPGFYLHHAQVDRIWWTYQNLKPEERTFAISGTITNGNVPPSRNGTLDDIIELGAVGGPLTLRQMMSTVGFMDSPLCYVYK